MPPVNIAVVGFGLIGQEHAQRLHDAPGLGLACVVDPAADPAVIQARFGCAMEPDLDALLARDDIDGVVLATPNDLHGAQAIQCIQAQRPVLIEKPIAHSLEQALAVQAQAAQHAMLDRCLVGHHRVYSATMQRACEIINSGQIGQPVAVNATALFYKPADYFRAGAWRTQPGGGPILINLIHEVGNLRALLGEITDVVGLSSSATREFAVEDTAGVVMRFKNGAIGTFLLSDCAAATHSWEQTSGENPSYYHDNAAHCYLVAGTRGSLSVPDLRLQRFAEGTESSWWNPMQSQSIAINATDPLVAQLEHFGEVIRRRQRPKVSLADGIENLRVAEQIADACRPR